MSYFKWSVRSLDELVGGKETNLINGESYKEGMSKR